MKRTLVTLASLSTLWLAGSLLPHVSAAPPAAGGVTELRVLGSTTYLPGSWSSLRIISYDSLTNKPVGGVPVELQLQVAGSAPHSLYRGETNREGTLDSRFLMPAVANGAAVIKVLSPAVSGLALSAPITVREQGKLYLTTDKPLYQPGQTVHLRMLSLKEPDLTPAAGVPCQLQIQDARGNVVFKSAHTSSKFGVVSARFDLATEVNMGEYRVQASCGQFTATRSFTVKRYVLPKFKVSITTDKPYYGPGDKMHGQVQAAYFFGKPVAKARVALHVKTFDTSEHDLEELEGVTDAEGRFTFNVVLPSHFTGRPLDQGNAPLEVVADVTDTANHKETGPLALSVVNSPVTVQLFPEAGNLIPALSNQVYVLSSSPDGKPLPCQVTLKIGNETDTVTTDASGFGSFAYTPPAGAPAPVYSKPGLMRPGRDYASTVPVSFTAVDKKGNRTSGATQFTQEGGSEAVLLRLDRALYRVGDGLHADIYSTRGNGPVYVDVVRDGQTLTTQTVEVKSHHAVLTLNLAADMFGSLTLHAYVVGADQNVVRDTRRIFVQPARDLMVDVKFDKTTYRPGQDAQLTFLVKTPQGAPRLAVLGVDMVDESLFSLADRQPGLEKVYFLLEKAMLDPKYEVHGFELQQAVEDPKASQSQTEQNLSRASLARMERPAGFQLDLSSQQIRVDQARQQVQKVQSAAYSYQAKHHAPLQSLADLVTEKLITTADLTDPWGHPLGWNKVGNLVYSMGPDGKADTSDDISLQNDMMVARRGGVFEERMAMDGAVMAPRPMAPAAAGAMAPIVMAKAASATTDTEKDEKQAPTRVRQYFPETLYTNPEVLTDDNGRASLTIPLADSITSWRLSAFASSVHGELGNANAQIRVFQPFFVDIDLPASLTQDDEISVPVAVYNYLPGPQTVTLKLSPGPWFTPLDGADRSLNLSRNQVSVVYYRIRTRGIGNQQLTVQAHGTQLSDAVRRTVEVEPNGAAFDTIKSDRLGDHVRQTFDIPKDAINGASKLWVTIYPGVFAQVMEGMDAIFRMPNGCFEQTSSTTYPNVLVMDYLKKLHRLTPETSMKAEGFINTGYQRLLTFEVKGGGFSVFGQYPGNPILTAYGLMEFADMAKVHDIDPRLLDRTKSWLVAQQSPDGSWSAGREGFYAEGWTNVPNSNLVATSYITWALLNTGDRGAAVQKAVGYVRDHMTQATEPYTAALVANTLVTAHDALAAKALSHLASMEIEDKDVVYWQTRIATAAFGTGQAGDVETTALAALAMEGDDHYSDQVNKAMTYLTRSKDRNGTWQSTQATVLAMKALVGSIDKAHQEANASVDIRVNGHSASVLKITPATSDVFHQVDLTSFLHGGTNEVELMMDGKGSCQYKMLGTVYRPWSEVGKPKSSEPLGLTVSYDRTHLAMDDTADCNVRIHNQTAATANQIVIDVGIPPGFEVHDDDLSALVEKRMIAKYSNTGRQLIIYLEKLDPNATLVLDYHVKARYPIKAQVPASTAYEYYDPSRHTAVPPSQMVVTR